MKIAYIVPGSEGSFYCENCMRDFAIGKAFKAEGHDISMVPMYLPLFTKKKQEKTNIPLFYGAINIYLKEMFPIFKHTPRWLKQFLNSGMMMKIASSMAGSTRASGLEEITLSMLMGEEGNQYDELKELIEWLKKNIKPDIIHLSNGLLSGLSYQIKKELKVPIVCSLQDEDQWIDTMKAPYQKKIWERISANSYHIDHFISVSRYYSDQMKIHLQLSENKISVIPIGIDLEGYKENIPTPENPIIGYLSRMSESLGLGKLVDAFISLRNDSRLSNLQLWITGGMTGDDKHFLKSIHKKISKSKLNESVRFFSDFSKKKRINFLKSISVLSVPAIHGAAFGSFQVEALASGIPVVEPRKGAFPEFLDATGGGLLYDPEQKDSLENTLKSLLLNPKYRKELSKKGREAVFKKYNIRDMVRKMIKLYDHIIRKDSENVA